MSAVRNAILSALIEGVLTDLMIKTNVENVYVDDTTTLAAKLSEIITSLNGKVTTEAMNTAISTAISDLIGGAPETYDTLKEIADYISAHEDVVTTLNAAIGNKADKSTVTAIQTAVSALQTTVNGLGALATKSAVAETDLDTALQTKINNAAAANHSHSNKALLDTYTQTEANLKDAVAKKHSHANKTVLDGITAEQVAGWDGKGKFYAQATQPAGLTENDLWARLV